MQQDLTSGAMGWPLQRLAQYAADLADDEGVTHGALAELLEQPLDKAVSCLRILSSLIRSSCLLDIFHAVLKAHRHARIGRSAVSPLLGFIHGISTRCEVEAILCHGLVTLYRDVFKLMDFEGEDDEFPDTGEDARRTMHAVIASLSRILSTHPYNFLTKHTSVTHLCRRTTRSDRTQSLRKTWRWRASGSILFDERSTTIPRT
ncbi:hypothetical protein IWQ60_005646 [Tieghemiomyces parasiticus]|uniref:Uncharacterized protein n=1 Tax=Tieghemiomyces parasiticus TaxID=78921 RepID=A0A9W8DYP1_9FUNG|nr:hypothetical protein IWQ60_005646 [Tieghemiomyces parasiticus]